MTNSASTSDLRPASIARRYLAVVLDGVIACAVVIAWVVVRTITFPHGIGALTAPVAAVVLGILCQVPSIPCYVITGQTPGMAVLGIRIVNAADDTAPSWPQAIGYHVAMILSSVPALIGWVPGVTRPDHRTWFDSVSKTRVVRAE